MQLPFIGDAAVQSEISNQTEQSDRPQTVAQIGSPNADDHDHDPPEQEAMV